MENFTDGTGQNIMVHDKEKCKGEYCCIHNPSDHHMVDWPLYWRSDRGFFERIDPEGVGHPDPDEIVFHNKHGKNISIHGCNGLCSPKNPERKSKEINWKEDFKYFLKQKNIWDKYIKSIKNNWKWLSFELIKFDSPAYFISNGFNWDLDSYPLWEDINKEWLEYVNYWKNEDFTS